jgi:hypothetical protein
VWSTGLAFLVTKHKHEHYFQCILMKFVGSNDICFAIGKSLSLHIGSVSCAVVKFKTHLACFLYLGKQQE